MFRACSKLLAPRVKTMTGIVGFPAQPRWREMILMLCDDGLNKLDSCNIPKGTFFRTSNENNFKYISQVCRSTDDYQVVEDTLNRGQVEEIIVLLEDQLDLIPKVAEWRAWEIDADDVKYEKDEAITLEYDCDIPKDHIPPKMKFLQWNGVYETEFTPEEVKQMQAAAQQPQQ
ncbi:NADH-ubiquinone oxidoreductase [Naegleria gruberi]|uniref:NADH-ubiquinone oxidoreductase n=1 Tax=Naegleria gruberi TaxID=5762 RepID=D2V410_NAEGR|nr:NADH-ubiquinone oxidoreductase [Naegleria gruberi]EFC48442.1 NADH-ubiquinone oxidoreductase [Naegleria gruberi]|eukprot:XP_002681186.1 NADH-ubiquinone oxidoreductase [Naegleria gruberi strain NEG-M]